jgi:hypothetical protein
MPFLCRNIQTSLRHVMRGTFADAFPEKSGAHDVPVIAVGLLSFFSNGNGLDERVCQVHDETMTGLLTLPAKAAPLISCHEPPTVPGFVVA